MKILDVLNAPWAIVPAKLEEITEIYARHLEGPKLSREELDAIRAANGTSGGGEERGYTVMPGGVAVLPIDGVLSKRMNMFSDISGGTSMQLLERDLRQALADSAVSSVLLAVDSPGGTVDGTQSVARAVLDARAGAKPVVAWIDGEMASAAYWIGSAADAVFLGANTDIVGSIGVAMQHVERSKMNERFGITRTDIYAGKYKRIASDNAPLSDAGRAYLQSQVDYYYSLFVDAVATHRGVNVEQVLSNMADGRIFIGQQAVSAGLVDGSSTLEALMAEMASGNYMPRRMKRMMPAGSAVIVSDANGAGDVPRGEDPQPQPETQTMDLKELREKHPELASALTTEGAGAERARIQAVFAQSMPGHEALVRSLAFDGKTTGPEAAVAVLAAEKAKKATVLANLAADAPKPAPAAPSASGDPAAKAAAAAPAAAADAPLEERAKAAWDRDAKLRAEYINFESYLAFERANAGGQVKILGQKKGA